MPSIKKNGHRWRAQLQVKGPSGIVRESKSFDTKSAARDWAEHRESVLRGTHDRSLQELFDRYAKEVSPKKKGERWEVIRLAKMGQLLGSVGLLELTPSHIAKFRDRRLGDVTGASVRREMVLLSSTLEIARKEWGWLKENPCKDVKKPSDGQPRQRRFSDKEIEAISGLYGVDTVAGISAAVFLFAIESAMRLGEICALGSSDVSGRVATVTDSKNGEARSVPLSKRALEIWSDYGPFQVTPMQVSTAFRRARDKAKITGCTFHDSRREATIRLSKTFSVLELAKITGHKDIKMILTYYSADADEMAGRLD